MFRTTAATKLNCNSSRSHAVLLIKLIKTDMTSSPYTNKSCKVYIIDLAGSEDNRRTGNEGIRQALDSLLKDGRVLYVNLCLYDTYSQKA